MREHRPSFTARLVSWARAAAISDRGGERHPVDPVAPALLGDPLVRLVARASMGATWVQQGLRVLSLGFVDQMQRRTEAIDDFVRDCAVGGIRQLVILGAGLDSRAWRMAELNKVRVFEVDHPATQAAKRRRLEETGLQGLPEEMHFVAVDFESDTLTDRLVRSGHRADEATAWICEGVTMYLTPHTTAATLRELSTLSGPGSRLAMTYVRNDHLVLKRPLRLLTLGAFRIIGESLLGPMTPQQFTSVLTTEGWHVEDADAMKGYPDVERLVLARLRLP